ncbi:MAG: hypothetical protein COB79_05345 [Zetaproteobacteria bacterium]|nr:MAG: hypothetical protein COB79_05345 [Zetaproteobacteria bacterium]
MKHMNMCPICGSTNMKFSNKQSHNLSVMGLPNVMAIGIHIYECSNCHEHFKEYPTSKAFKELIIRSLVTVSRDLTGREMAFIRKNLGFTARKWASLIRVHNVTLSDWENEKKAINKTAEIALRMRAALDLEINPEQIEVGTSDASVDISLLPITTTLPKVANWSHTQKMVVNG